MRQLKFAAQVDAWVAKVEGRAVEVFHEAARNVAYEVMKPKDEGGHMPVVTGNLRNSLAASRQGLPTVIWRRKGEDGKSAAVKFEDNGFQIESEISAASIGESIFFGFQAPYAAKAERAAGNGFVRLTAQRWPQLVEEAIRSVKEGGSEQSRLAA